MIIICLPIDIKITNQRTRWIYYLHACKFSSIVLRYYLFWVYSYRDKKKQKSPADAGKPARRKTMKKFLHFEVITSSRQVENPVFVVGLIKFLIQITTTYNS